MQEVSSLYREIISGNHTVETRVVFGEIAPYDVYGEDVLAEVYTSSALFSGNEPEAGACVSQEVTVKMLKPDRTFSGLEQFRVYARVTDGQRYSEWIPQGVFYLDSADEAAGEGDVRWIEIHGYDAMLFAEQDFPYSKGQEWPATDIAVVRDIAIAMSIEVDGRTWEIMDKGYSVQYTTRSIREYLSCIAAMYAGCFIITETGKLRLVCFWDIPKETKYLIDNSGNAITFGGVRILV